MPTPNPSRQARLQFVFGPLTRLGGHVLKNLERPVVVARSTREANERLRDFERVLDLEKMSEFAWPSGPQEIDVFLLAIGEIHPRENCDLAQIDAAQERQIEGVREILRRYPEARVSIVFVSTSLVFALRSQRLVYVASKLWIEAELRGLAHRHGRIHLSVIYPGRLFESYALAKPGHWLGSRFASVARCVLRLADQRAGPVDVLMGLDSRLLILTQALLRILNFRT